MRERKFIGVVKGKSPLGVKLLAYIKWKYNDTRGCNVGLIQKDGMLKVTTSLWGRKPDSALTEWINPHIMNKEIREHQLL